MTAAIARPIQKAEKLPATRPDRMVSEAPPSRDALTISFTWRECELVKTLVSSGMMAAAKVPHEMMTESFHHNPPPSEYRMAWETPKVTTIESSDVIHTSEVSGASKSILLLPALCARAMAPFTR